MANNTPDFKITVGADDGQIYSTVLDDINRAIEKINKGSDIQSIDVPIDTDNLSKQVQSVFKNIKIDPIDAGDIGKSFSSSIEKSISNIKIDSLELKFNQLFSKIDAVIKSASLNIGSLGDTNSFVKEATNISNTNKVLENNIDATRRSNQENANSEKQHKRTKKAINDDTDAIRDHIKVLNSESVSKSGLNEDADKIAAAAKRTIDTLGDGQFELKQLSVDKIFDDEGIIKVSGSLQYYNKELQETITQHYKAVKANDDETDSAYELSLANERLIKTYNESSVAFNKKQQQQLANLKIETLQEKITSKGLKRSGTETSVFNVDDIDDSDLRNLFKTLDASTITSSEKLKEFASQLSIVDERIKALDQMAKGAHAMDSLAALKNKIKALPEDFKSLNNDLNKLDSVPETLYDKFESLNELIDMVTNPSESDNIEKSDLITFANEASSRLEILKKEIRNIKQEQRGLFATTLNNFNNGIADSNQSSLLSKLSGYRNSDKNSVEQVKKLKDQYTELQKQVISYNQLIVDDAPEEALERQKLVVENAARAYKQLSNETRGYIRAASAAASADTKRAVGMRDLHNLLTDLNNFEQSNSKVFDNELLANRLKGLRENITQGITTSNDDKSYVANLRTELSSIKGTAIQLGVTGQTFLQKVQSQVEKLGVYLSGTAFLGGAIAQFGKMIRNVVDLDSAMTELKKVTDETDRTYEKFLNNATARAQKFGATLSDVVVSTATFAKMGYDLASASEMANAALVAINVWDNTGTTEETANAIISQIKGFGLAATDAMTVVDIANQVSNEYAVTSGNIADAMADAGAALSAAGNSYNEAVSLFTATNEIIQDWSKTSTALRTIASRLRNTAGELTDLEIDSDGAAESITQLQQKLYKLSGVNILSDNDTFKSTTQILRELSSIWETISDVDQAEVTRLVAGTRQASIFSAVMKNFSTVEDVITTAAKSEGKQTCPYVQKCA